MGPTDAFLHLAGFLAPAAALALLLPLAARLVRPAPVRWWVQSASVFVAGVAVLAAGLWWFGRDGKMATYLTLVVAAGSVQWLASRAWR
jgi:hypothetical protein